MNELGEPRPYKEESDLHAMQDLLMAGRKSCNGTYYIHPGDLSWWLYYPPIDGAFWDQISLWDDPAQSGRLLGWALLTPNWVGLDVYFQPELRGTTLALKMAALAEQKAEQLARENGKQTISAVWVWHDDDFMGSYFQESGFTLKPGYVYMTRQLDEEFNPVALADGFILRSCRGVDEVADRAKAQYGSFGSTTPFERYLERFTSFMSSPVYHPELDVVAASLTGEIGAFCIVWTDRVNLEGHFEPVGTHPDFQRKGLARAVIVEGLRRLQLAGMKSADVVTFEDNLPAISLYQSLGFRVTGHLGTYEKDVPNG